MERNILSFIKIYLFIYCCMLKPWIKQHTHTLSFVLLKIYSLNSSHNNPCRKQVRWKANQMMYLPYLKPLSKTNNYVDINEDVSRGWHRGCLPCLADLCKRLLTVKRRCRNKDQGLSESLTKELIFQRHQKRETLTFLEWPNYIFKKDSTQHQFIGQLLCVLGTFIDDYDLKTMKI